MSATRDAAAAYYQAQQTLTAAVVVLTDDLRRCQRRLHPGPAPAVPAAARATRRRVEAALDLRHHGALKKL